MAEAIINHLFSDQWLAYSAGINPAGYVHKIAVNVLEEIGISHQGTSKSVDVFRNQDFDLVITVCDDAENECPTWLGKGAVVHHSFKDPASVTGSKDEILEAFREVRDQILTQIPLIFDEYIKRGN
jgi:arsenate reductase